MAKMTKAQAKRRITEIHRKINNLMANEFITTTQFVKALSVIEQIKNYIDKK